MKAGPTVVDTFQRYRGHVILSLVFAILFGGYILYDRRPQPEPIEILEPTVAPTPTLAPIRVHVAGGVRHPGVYSLPPQSRVIDAVETAGGMSADADQERVNLADYVRDGQQVYIPKIGTLPPASPASSGGSGPGTTSRNQAGHQININTASATELETLPGIGKVYAERIIAYRETQGPFTDPAQIKKVKGIGDVCYERIKTHIVVH